MSATIDPELRLVLPRRSVRQHLVDIWRYRELWLQLVRKELHVRYQKSVLGFAWSMLNPLFLLVVYSIVFGILGQSFSWFGIWLLAGILVWNFFATSLSTGTQAITANGYLVGKVNFPREVLPLASVGAAFVHLMLVEPADGRRAAGHPVPRRLVVPLADRPGGDHARRARRGVRHPAERRSTSTPATPPTCSSWCCWPGSG